VALRELCEHLAIARRSRAARTVRERLTELERLGLVSRGREHGVTVWSPTARGERAVAATRGMRALPESPRHRAWRNARAAAGQELPRFRAELAEALAEAGEMLLRADAQDAPASEAWLALGRELAGGCRRLGSARHCLHEWAEPGEDELDPDAAALEAAAERGAAAAGTEPEEARRARLAALRNVRLWREPG
jgi:hypothetical protein